MIKLKIFRDIFRYWIRYLLSPYTNLNRHIFFGALNNEESLVFLSRRWLKK